MPIFTSIYVAPQGRLTLTSMTPVMTSDEVAATNIYYTPYQGNIVPIYNSANTEPYTFSELTVALNSANQLSGKVYDLFIFITAGAPMIGATQQTGGKAQNLRITGARGAVDSHRSSGAAGRRF